MNEDRRSILEMLAAGQINADEADRLLRALETESTAKAKAKYLRVVVEDDEADEGPTRVNIRVPMQLLRAGVKLASLVPAPAQQYVNDALQSRGMTFDLNQIKAENLEQVVENLADLTVDVDDAAGKTKVKVFCE
jgi:predicted DNA binding CopG/RHH family protein